MDFAEKLKCTDQSAKCLRLLQARDILINGLAIRNQHIVDGTTLPLPHATAFRTGQFSRIPVMFGTTRDEWTFINAIIEIDSGKPLTADQYPAEIASAFGQANASQILQRYPLSAFSSPALALSAAQTDAGFSCSTRRVVQWVSEYVPQTYAYEFADRTAPSYMQPVSFPTGSSHTFELQYLFPAYHGATGTPHQLNAAQARLSDDIVKYWTNFALQANPNSADTPSWPSYRNGSTSDNWQSLNLPRPVTLSQGEYASVHQCDFWDALYK
jgi:para-nitrobenzyl esterase